MIDRFACRWPNSRLLSALFAVLLPSLICDGSGVKAGETSQPVVTTRAFLGPKFGVGEVVIVYPKSSELVFPQEQPVWLLEGEGRALYPSVTKAYGGEKEPRIRNIAVRFLFKGTAPFSVRVVADKTYTARLKPETNPRGYNDVRTSWWARFPHQFNNNVGAMPRSPNPTMMVYLSSMMSRRLGLTMPNMNNRYYYDGRTMFAGGSSWESFIEFVLGTRSVKEALQLETLLKDSDKPEPADQTLPTASAPPALEIPQDFKGGPVDGLSQAVPEECFYLRCDTVAHLNWFRQALESLGTLAGGTSDVSAVDYGIVPRLERQLALRIPTADAQPVHAAIRQLALIGSDPFVREGAALGVVIDAKDSDSIRSWIDAERQRVLQQADSLKVQSIELQGGTAQALVAPDNSVRSFHVSRGTFHFVTNSKTLAQRFLEAANGTRSLAKLREYQYVLNEKFKTAGQSPLFLYMSDPFFRNLVSPHYRVEMTRRAKAASELELVELARLAAGAERVSASSVKDLIGNELLPAHFGKRSDGSTAVITQGIAIDSLRGAAGTFLPIPDVPIKRVTKSEVEAYRQFSQFYARQWNRTDPVALGLRFQPSKDGKRVTLVFDLFVAPFSRSLYAMLEAWLPPATKKYVTPPKGDLLSATLVSPQFISRLPKGETGHLFAGFRDEAMKAEWKRGELITEDWDRLEDFGWYIGQASTPGILELLYPSIDWDEEDIDPQGYVVKGRRWYRVWNEVFMAESRSKAVLQAATPQLKYAQGRRPAQLRLFLADLSQAKFRTAANTAAYASARVGSARTAVLLNHYAQQFRLKPKEVISAASRVLGGGPLCALGGRWQFPDNASTPRVVSDRWSGNTMFEEDGVPQWFRHPFIHNLHGASLELTLKDRTLRSHWEITIPAPR